MELIIILVNFSLNNKSEFDSFSKYGKVLNDEEQTLRNKPYLDLDFSSTHNSITPGPTHSRLNSQIENTIFGEDLIEKYKPKESPVAQKKIRRKGLMALIMKKPKLDENDVSTHHEYIKYFLLTWQYFLLHMLEFKILILMLIFNIYS